MSRVIIAVLLAILGAFACVTRERVTDTADIVTAARETVDIGEHVVAVLERDTRIAYRVSRSVLTGERAEIAQAGGRAIYRVREGALAVRSSGGALDVEGDAVFVVDGARYAIAEGEASAHGLAADATLLRALDDVNDAPGGDLHQRFAELKRMRADLAREAAEQRGTPAEIRWTTRAPDR